MITFRFYSFPGRHSHYPAPLVGGCTVSTILDCSSSRDDWCLPFSPPVLAFIFVAHRFPLFPRSLMFVFLCWLTLLRFQLFRGAIVNRTSWTHKNLNIYLLLLRNNIWFCLLRSPVICPYVTMNRDSAVVCSILFCLQ